jgi:hypothetical protein
MFSRSKLVHHSINNQPKKFANKVNQNLITPIYQGMSSIAQVLDTNNCCKQAFD